MSAKPQLEPEPPGTGLIYVWQLPVRLSHWLIVASIAVLAVTGYFIGNPVITTGGLARDRIVAGTMRSIHLYAAWVFGVSVVVRVYWMFAGSYYARWDQFIPVSRDRFNSIWQAMRFYSFMRREPQLYPGHSGLAALAYAGIFMIYFVMIVTGLALYYVYAPANSVFQGFRFLVPIYSRFIHHIGMWILLMFVIQHVYSTILFSVEERSGIVDSMFTGYKRITPEAEGEGHHDA